MINSVNSFIKKYNQLLIILFLYSGLILITWSWSYWLDVHKMNGLFTISMKVDNFLKVIYSILRGDFKYNEVEIFFALLNKINTLNFGFSRQLELDSTRWSFFTWLLFAFSPCFFCIFFNSYKNHLTMIKHFLFIYFILFIGLVLWLFGVYMLAVNSFQYTSEGLFPSIDRYIGIYLNSVILLTFFFYFFIAINSSNYAIKLLLFILMIILIICAPVSSKSFFSKAEVNDGFLERALFKNINAKDLDRLRNLGSTCLLYSGPGTFSASFFYDLIPTRIHNIYHIKDKSIDLDLIDSGCSSLLSFCVNEEDCKKMNNFYPHLFQTEISSNHIFLYK